LRVPTQIAAVTLSQNRTFRALSDVYHYAIDTGIGYVMFSIMGILSFVGFVGALQMKMLFNDSFSEKVRAVAAVRLANTQMVPAPGWPHLPRFGWRHLRPHMGALCIQ